MYVPGMLPSTCVLPSQKLRIEAKRHERQREAHELVKSTRAFDDIDAQSLTLKSLNADKVTHLCKCVFRLPLHHLDLNQPEFCAPIVW